MASLFHLEVYLYDEELFLRGTFIIDPTRELVAIEIYNNIGRSAKQLYRKLKAANLLLKMVDRFVQRRFKSFLKQQIFQ